MGATFIGTTAIRPESAQAASYIISQRPLLESLLIRLVPNNELSVDVTKYAALMTKVRQEVSLLEERLVKALHQNRATGPDTIRSYLTAQIRADFANARTIKVNGWNLATTEAALIVLVSKYRPV